MAKIALSEYESKKVLQKAGIEIPEEYLVKDRESLIEASKKLGFPLVIKGCGRGLAHKTELGLVKVGIRDEETLLREFESIMKSGNGVEGVLVQRFIPGKREFIAGILRDPQFGPCVMFGLGGIFTEVLKDVSFRIAPVSEVDVEEMFEELKGKALLGAFRGEPPVNRKKLVDTIVKLSNLPFQEKNVVEVDLNPIIPYQDEIYIVDALVVIEDEG